MATCIKLSYEINPLLLYQMRDSIDFDDCVASLIVQKYGAENFDYLLKHSYKKIAEVTDIYENSFMIDINFILDDEDATQYKLKFG